MSDARPNDRDDEPGGTGAVDGESGDNGTDEKPDDVPPHRAVARSGRLDSEQRQGTPYTESQVIMPTVKIVAPFAFTFGLFVTFHGSGSPGGGFQGGAIMAAVVFMIAFAFGIEATRDWLANTVVVALAVGGTLAFAAIGLIPVARGGAFLQYDLLPIPVKYGLESVEVFGIAAIVSGVLMGLFFLLANGFASDGSGFGDGGTGDDIDDIDDIDDTDESASTGSDPSPVTDGGER
ncbi:monovalent cation/H+ antiporter subunit B [Halorubrum aidingense JCM 13560]|uniref:Monovalent cation/H+ antiporter subunit B n=1 Tax=Halorubrum aidingense JCM 13560 TaxID=1230454 RepID=M0PGD0_9EURY|nr:MnhB domain-containing protein [Halorubrum aidingense]EMA68953.1 monovalent cation/H+ antiporter subunit B [Halorubrum aidingense JCM 13560]